MLFGFTNASIIMMYLDSNILFLFLISLFFLIQFFIFSSFIFLQ